MFNDKRVPIKMVKCYDVESCVCIYFVQILIFFLIFIKLSKNIIFAVTFDRPCRNVLAKYKKYKFSTFKQAK